MSPGTGRPAQRPRSDQGEPDAPAAPARPVLDAVSEAAFREFVTRPGTGFRTGPRSTPTSGGPWSALDRLPQRMRAAVVLRYYEDMTEPEIADALGVSRGTVKSTVSRAVTKLRSDSELSGQEPRLM
jgi:hypothetical protein